LTGERLVGLFLFGLLLLSPPLIGAFDTASLVRGIPVLYLYLFVAWALLIGLMALIVERPDPDEETAEDGSGADTDHPPTGDREPERC